MNWLQALWSPPQDESYEQRKDRQDNIMILIAVLLIFIGCIAGVMS